MNNAVFHASQHDGDAAPLEETSVFLSVVEDGPSMAFCSYNEELNQIQLEQIVTNGFEVETVIDRVILSVRPTLLVLPCKIVGNSRLLQLLTKPAPEIVDDVDTAVVTPPLEPQSTTTPYRIAKASSLDVKNCRELILKVLRVKSIMKDCRRSNQGRNFPLQQHQQEQLYSVSHYHALASILDFESKLQVQVVGAMLSFLQTTIFQYDSVVLVNTMTPLQSSCFVHLPRCTVDALHIFATEHHPLSQGHSKEGFSLLSLLDRTKSRAGRERLREWMTKPLKCMEQIGQRQDGIELFLHRELADETQRLVEMMGRLGHVSTVLLRMQKSSCKAVDFLVLIKSLSYAVAICENLHRDFVWSLQQWVATAQQQEQFTTRDNDEESQGYQPIAAANYLKFIQSILGRCHPVVLRDLFERIGVIIDQEATAEQQAFVVLSGYNSRLDEFKETYARLPDTLVLATEHISRRLPHLISLFRVVFFPQIGFLVALDGRVGWNLNTPLTDDFEYIFCEGHVSFYKSSEMLELDNSIGDVHANIKDAEAIIASELEDDILDCGTELRETYSALADLDCILSLASSASDHNYVRPVVVSSEEKCILIQNGGHPLHEHIIDSNFIRNHAVIDETNRVNIVSGPNYSGKSCYARQVGVLVYMAHIGSFIPCERARISIVDRILTQFSVVETCTVPQSSFQLDLTRMARIMNSATENSLVLIDEFGKGTSPASGIALLAAVLKKLSRTGCKVLCTTHFLEVFSMHLLDDGVNGVRAWQMAVTIPEVQDDVAMPLFQLQEGVATSSAGLVCARMSGVKESVIHRAHEVVTAMKEGKQVRPLPEILRYELSLSDLAKSTINNFIRTDWKDASDEDVITLRESIGQM